MSIRGPGSTLIRLHLQPQKRTEPICLKRSILALSLGWRDSPCQLLVSTVRTAICEKYSFLDMYAY